MNILLNLVSLVSSFLCTGILAANNFATKPRHERAPLVSKFSSAKRCFGLYDEFLIDVIRFLDAKSALQLRACNKLFLDRYNHAAEAILMTYLKPKISSGYECLMDGFVSASKLLPLIHDLKKYTSIKFFEDMFSGLDENSDRSAIIKLAVCDRFDEFLKLIVPILYLEDKSRGWQLISALPAGFCSAEEIHALKDENFISAFYKFQHAYLEGLLPFTKQTVNEMHFDVRFFNPSELQNACATCIFSVVNPRYGDGSPWAGIILFKYLIDSAKENNLITESIFKSLFLNSHRIFIKFFVEYLIKSFPEFHAILPEFFFYFIRIEWYEDLRLYLRYYSGPSITEILNEDGLNPLEYASKLGRTRAVKILSYYCDNKKRSSWPSFIGSSPELDTEIIMTSADINNIEDPKLRLFEKCKNFIIFGDISEFEEKIDDDDKISRKMLSTEQIVKFLEYSAKYNRPLLIEQLYWNYPILRSLKTQAVFKALEYSNHQALKALLTKSKSGNFDAVNENGLKPFEVAAMNDDDIEPLEIMKEYWDIDTWMPAALLASIRAESMNCFFYLLDNLKGWLWLDDFIQKEIILEFINAIIIKKHTEMLELLLKSISTEFEGITDSNLKDDHPVFIAINNNYPDGVKCLVQRFGSEILEIKNSRGIPAKKFIT